MKQRAFVDVHTHMVPSGDDGVHTVEEGRALVRQAAERGTGILFATPHVWPHLKLSREREQRVRQAYSEVATGSPIELRLGFELTPMPSLLDEDPQRYVLAGTASVLIEVPFTGSAKILFAVCEHIESAGLRPVIAHPERTEAGLERPALASELVERGWLVQVNSTSLLGRHGPESADLAWALLEGGEAALVGSDGHRQARPPFLDEAYEAAVARLGEHALRFFDGRALGISAARAAA